MMEDNKQEVEAGKKRNPKYFRNKEVEVQAKATVTPGVSQYQPLTFSPIGVILKLFVFFAIIALVFSNPQIFVQAIEFISDTGKELIQSLSSTR